MQHSVREYKFCATNGTVEALRKLRRAWRGWHLHGPALTIDCGEGVVVRIEVEEASPEPGFTVARLNASVLPGAEPVPTVSTPFEGGNNDVVLFNSEAWLQAPASEPASMDGDFLEFQFHGPPGSSPGQGTTASCLVTDGVLLDNQSGARILVRCTAFENSLEVIEDDSDIEAFARTRGYL